jgi:hypothetical protein
MPDPRPDEFIVDAGADVWNAVTASVCGQPAPAPGCVASSGCNSTYIPPSDNAATNGWVGYYTFQTVDVSCQSPPTTIQQWMNGSWVSLEPWLPAVGDAPASGTTYRSFDLGSPQGAVAIPIGPLGGTIQQVRACVTTNVITSGACDSPMGVTPVTVCDAPSSITIAACLTCTPAPCREGFMSVGGCECAPSVPPKGTGGGPNKQ